MPTYEYSCRSCGKDFEIVQGFTDDALTVCPSCGGELRKVFGSVGIVFKGSGFYKTDSRSSTTATAPASTNSSEGASSEPSTPSPSTTEKSTNGSSTTHATKEPTKSTPSPTPPASTTPANK